MSWKARLLALEGLPFPGHRANPIDSEGSLQMTEAADTPNIMETTTIEFTIITGLSGAGKSHAMAAFEDAGFFCIDNLPPQMIPAAADLFSLEGSKVERVAVVSDVRGGKYFEEIDELSQRAR